VLKLLPELLIGPLLVGGSTLAGRRWGPHVGGLVSVFPAVVGPVLFITASERGVVAAAQAANGTLLGLVGLSGFVLTYGWVALRAPWTASLLSAWACATVLAAIAGWLAGGAAFPAGLAAAVAALLLARRAMPPGASEIQMGPAPAVGIATRMLVTAVLVGLLSATAVLGGPLLGGLLAGLPILASVLATFTHRGEGPEAVIALLRGMVAGMAGFVGFCAVVAWLIVPLGMAGAFVTATAVALGLQLLVLARRPCVALAHQVAPGPVL
jgi:hypothetical protein